jgi:hypothetical protein
MSNLAQAQESVHMEQHAVQLQIFLKVGDEGEGIGRVSLPRATESSPVQKDTHEHQDRVRPPAQKNRMCQ